MKETLSVGKKLALFGVLIGAFVAPQAASAEIASVLDGAVSCEEVTGGVRYCGENDPPTTPRTTAPSFDGAPIDVTAAFPPEPSSGPDGDFPLVMLFHGYGGSKFSLGQMQHWVDQGYATFSMSDRGFHESCGSAESVTAGGSACDGVYIRLIDNRYEVRDAQFYAGQLVDEGVVDPAAIGATGGSYGGGMSMALGALNDRVVNEDYSLSPWTSPEGTPLHMAATAPVIPWTDLAYSLAPNGSTLDYVADAPYSGLPGVQKQSYVTGLYASGLGAPGRYAPEGTDPTADVTGWRNLLNAGEPYGSEVDDVITEMTTHHSSYYIDHSQPPAPMLMSSGFTDDLFPVDEIIRYYNRTRTEYPDADIAMTMGDFGHPRGQNKGAEMTAVNVRIDDWLAYYLKGEGSPPDQGVVARAQTCPGSADPGEAHTAADWAQMAPGEVRISDDAQQVIAADSTTGGQFNPITTGACASVPDDPIAGAATYEFDPAPASGYTMMGSATVIADFKLDTATSQVAARLLDVAPDGTETLVDRGLWRPATGGGFERQVFQLHPNGWTFAEGHTPKLELIGNDGSVGGGSLASYGRPSDGQGEVTVKNLEARIPVIEKPGALGGLVKAPAAKVLPDGYELAAGFAALKSPKPKLDSSKLTVKGSKATAEVKCPATFAACTDGKLNLTADDKYKGKKVSFKAGSAKFDSIKGGKVAKVEVKLSNKAKKFLKKKKPKLAVETSLKIGEVDGTTTGGGKLVRKK